MSFALCNRYAICFHTCWSSSYLSYALGYLHGKVIKKFLFLANFCSLTFCSRKNGMVALQQTVFEALPTKYPDAFKSWHFQTLWNNSDTFLLKLLHSPSWFSLLGLSWMKPDSFALLEKFSWNENTIPLLTTLLYIRAGWSRFTFGIGHRYSLIHGLC